MPAVRFTSIGWASCIGELSPAAKATGPESSPDVSMIQVVSSFFISVAICVVQGLPKGWGKSSLNTSVESPLVTNFMVYLPSGSTRTVIRCSTQPGHTKPMNRINRTVLRLIVKDTSLRNQCKWNKKGVPFGTPFTNETVLF